VVQDDIVGLGIVVESGDLEVGILLAKCLFLLAVVAGGVPLALGEFQSLVDVQGYHHIVLLQAFQYLWIYPYVLLHLAAVDAAMPCEVNQ